MRSPRGPHPGVEGAAVEPTAHCMLQSENSIQGASSGDQRNARSSHCHSAAVFHVILVFP